VTESLKPVRRALGYILDMKARVFLGLICAALVGAVTTANAKVVEILVNDCFISSKYHQLKFCVGLIIGIHVLKGIFLFVSRYFLNQVGHVASLRLRNDLFRHIQRLSLAYFHANRTGQIISRMDGDVMVVQNLLSVLARSVNDASQVAFGVAAMFWIQFRLALLTFVILPILSLAVRKFSKRLRSIGSQMQARLGDIAAATHESVLGMKEIQSFGMEEITISRFAAVNADNYRINMKATLCSALTQPVVELFHAFGIGLVIWCGSVFVIDKSISPGELMAFLTCLGMIFHPIKTLTDVYNFVRQSEGAMERIFELLDHPVEIVSKPDAVVLTKVRGAVRYEGVSFWYTDPERPVVVDLNLAIEPGEVIALVGHSGSGKTTLVNLIPRFYDVRNGRITIDGQDIRDLELASLRRHIGLVPQETILFAGSILENIRFGRQEATLREIRQAACDANALEFIEKLPHGLDSQIGERGVMLSGGEKQRVAIARAILKDPRILILDEATSSLDTESERLVQEAIDRLMHNRTTFVIAHRLSTVVHSDKIIVLEDGQVMEIGTHAQLFAQNGIYHRLCRAQFKAA